MGSAGLSFLVQQPFSLTTRGGVSIDYRMVDIRNRDLAHRSRFFFLLHVLGAGGIRVFVSAGWQCRGMMGIGRTAVVMSDM
jgi:hypothetical protein